MHNVLSDDLEGVLKEPDSVLQRCSDSQREPDIDSGFLFHPDENGGVAAVVFYD